MTEPRRIQLTLPVMPPPLSACFVNVGRNGRADSARYKEFKGVVDAHLSRSAADILGTPYKQTFRGDVVVTYSVVRPDRRVRDLDNLTKALGDLLVRNHVLKDDSQIVDLRIRWSAAPQDMPVQINVTTVEQARMDETTASLKAYVSEQGAAA